MERVHRVAIGVERLGEAALVAVADAEPSLEIQRRVWALARTARALPFVSDAVAGDGNVTLLFDADAADVGDLERTLRDAWENGDALASGRPASVEIPVKYGGDAGPDLAAVARACTLLESEVVERHRSGEYVVWFLGFVPGFAYLRGLDPRLYVPRRTEPRTAVPAGSVAIAGEYSGIYPSGTPGGWPLIGRTAVTPFDPHRDPPALLAPGDRVRFVDLGA